MKDHIEPEKVLVPTPQPVKVREQIRASDWIPPVCALVAVLILGLAWVSMQGAEPAKERATDTMPIYTFESDTSCPGCVSETCPDCTWLSRFVGALDTMADTPLEIKDVLHRAYIESRFTPSVVSETGDWGICQINKKANPGVDVERLLTDPEYAAEQCLGVYRTVKQACGSRWQCCYRFGVKGCKGR